MFDDYQIAIENAQQKEDEIVDEYNNKKEAHSLAQQKMMEQEAKSMRSGQALKDYNPTAFVNELTRMKHEFDALEQDEQTELNEVKRELDTELHKLTDFPVTEICKYIGCDTSSPGNYKYVCRVWFTLISVPEFSCVPGDPIRVEWIDMTQQHVDRTKNSITYSSKRTSPGLKGLFIPNFNNTASITSVNNFYPINQWGETSSQTTYWINWVKVNRPIPE
jgi:hypothetical protein